MNDLVHPPFVAALTESARDGLFDLMVERSPDAIVRHDLAQRCTYANALVRAACADPLNGNPPAELPMVFATPAYAALLRSVLDSGQPAKTALAWLDAQGHRQWSDLRLTPETDSEGQVTGCVSMAHDITALKDAQSKLEKAEALARMGFWEMDMRTGESRLSPHACHLVGQEPGWSPSRRDLLLVHREEDRPTIAKLYESAMAARQASFSYDYVAEHVAGDPRHFHCQAEVAYSPNGAPLTVFAVTQDVTDREQAEARLRQREQEFRVLSENTPDTIARYDLELRRTFANAALARLTGKPAATLLGGRPTDYANTAQCRAYEAELLDALSSGEAREYTYRWEPNDGHRMASHIRIVPERNAEGAVVSVLAIGRDISALEESERRLEAAQRVARICTWEIDYVLKQPSVSQAGREILGLNTTGPVTLREFLDIVPTEQRATIDALYRQAFSQGLTELAYEHHFQSPEGQRGDAHNWVRLEYAPDGHVTRAMGVTQDVTHLKQLQRETHQLAFYDPLTKLPNRALLHQRLQQSLADASSNGTSVGLLLLDIDHFQKVNDSLGYGAGDTLLRTVAGRLTDALRENDTVSRLGGDEFAILVPRMRQASDLSIVAERIKKAFSLPVELPDTQIFLTVSAGMAVYPSDGVDVDEMLAHADAAMNHAKSRGRDNFQFYARELTATALERLRLEADLRRAIERNELELFYQPKVDLGSGEVVGAEALMRWRQPERGLVPPDRFIGIAEEAGLIIDMGAWALHSACATATRWNAGRLRPLKIAINLSPRQFYSGDLVGTVREALTRNACRPEWIELEITESLLLNDRADIRAMLGQLHDLGLTIAIDDFGTGYSALSYLTRFPVDTLKIDRSFIRELTTNRDSEVLTKAIVTLGHSLRMQIVAEGVETVAQRDFLGAWACQMAQGFLYSKPVPQDEFMALMAGWRPAGGPP